jgi:DNA-binding response OmpR family regulator
MAGAKILIVEDDKNLVTALEYNLEHEGYQVVSAGDGEAGLELARQTEPGLVILDIMLPNLSGLEVCRILRKESNVPVILLTAKAEEVDKVVGLELGADDYITKPFSMRELIARVRSLLRRSRMYPNGHYDQNKPVSIQSGNLEVNLLGRTASVSDERMVLKPREFDLLVFLLMNKDRVLSREEILEAVWGYGYVGDTRTVDVHIRWLREKIEENPSKPTRLVTVRGSGYRFER